MRGLVEQTIVWLVVVVFVGMAIHTPTTVFIETHWPHLELLAKSWKELVLGALLLLILLSLYKRGALRQVVGDKVVQLVAAIAVVHVALLLLFDNAYVSELAGLLIDLRFYLFFVELYVAARYIPGVHKYGLRAAAVGAAFIVVFGVLQVFVLPKDILASIGYSDATIKPYLTVATNKLEKTRAGDCDTTRRRDCAMGELFAERMDRGCPRNRDTMGECCAKEACRL